MLHIALYLGHLQVIQILLAAGASVGRVEQDNEFAALYPAIMPGNAGCVKTLLGAEADPDQIMASRVTLLMLAA